MLVSLASLHSPSPAQPVSGGGSRGGGRLAHPPPNRRGAAPAGGRAAAAAEAENNILDSSKYLHVGQKRTRETQSAIRLPRAALHGPGGVVGGRWENNEPPDQEVDPVRVQQLLHCRRAAVRQWAVAKDARGLRMRAACTAGRAGRRSSGRRASSLARRVLGVEIGGEG